MIDPEGQAYVWIQNMERDNKLCVLKPSDENFMRNLENAVQFGLPVLIENISSALDPQLEPLLAKRVFKQHGIQVSNLCFRFPSKYSCQCFFLLPAMMNAFILQMMKLRNSVVEYSPQFRLFLTTTSRNPSFSPELLSHLNVLNFAITEVGLEEQLLTIVVSVEKAKLEEKKSRVMTECASNNELLTNLENQILNVLSSAQVRIYVIRKLDSGRRKVSIIRCSCSNISSTLSGKYSGK